MKNDPYIHNLRSLEKEIDRREAKLKKTQEKLQDNVAFFRENYRGLFMNTFSFKRKRCDDQNNCNSFFAKEPFHSFFSALTQEISEKATARWKGLFGKLSRKGK